MKSVSKTVSWGIEDVMSQRWRVTPVLQIDPLLCRFKLSQMILSEEKVSSIPILDASPLTGLQEEMQPAQRKGKSDRSLRLCPKFQKKKPNNLNMHNFPAGMKQKLSAKSFPITVFWLNKRGRGNNVVLPHRGQKMMLKWWKQCRKCRRDFWWSVIAMSMVGIIYLFNPIDINKNTWECDTLSGQRHHVTYAAWVM